MIDVRRMIMAAIAKGGENMQTQKGSFIGNGTASVNISCPFEPDICVTWNNELKVNPGISAGCVIDGAWVRGHGNLIGRWSNGTNINPTGYIGTDDRNIGNYYTTYNSGILELSSGSGSNAGFFFSFNYEYEYVLIKL